MERIGSIRGNENILLAQVNGGFCRLMRTPCAFLLFDASVLKIMPIGQGVLSSKPVKPVLGSPLALTFILLRGDYLGGCRLKGPSTC
jgi:hypothetical protein